MKNYCWVCEIEFEKEEAPYCDTCTTVKCPNGHCFCSLGPEAKRAVDMAMKTYGIWTGNPKKKKSGLAEDLYYAFLEKGYVKSKADFDARHQDLYKQHPEIVEQVKRERGK